MFPYLASGKFPAYPFSFLLMSTAYYIRDRESGNLIESFSTLSEAVKKLSEFEASDEVDGTYEPNFYEIKTIPDHE